MPCYDSRDDDLAKENAVKLKKVEAALCGIFASTDRHALLDRVDYVKAGVTREWIDDWYADHQKKDRPL